MWCGVGQGRRSTRCPPWRRAGMLLAAASAHGPRCQPAVLCCVLGTCGSQATAVLRKEYCERTG
jgi:hypothetical protein